MTSKDIKKVIRDLKEHFLSVSDVPEEIAFDKTIIQKERQFGLRQSHNRGFDVITQKFFVEEELFVYRHIYSEPISRFIKTTFDTLEEYYDFLEGDIYEEACYKYYNFEQNKEFLLENKIDVVKLKKREAFISQTINDITFEPSPEELCEYKEVEKRKKLCKKWINKFNKCDCYEDFSKTASNYLKSELQKFIDVTFYFWNYIFEDIADKNRFSIIMQYMSTGAYPEYIVTKPLCLIYDPEDVLNNYNYSSGAKSTNKKHKKELKDYVERLSKGDITHKTVSFFDKYTHFYCEKTTICEERDSYCRYFETFDEFIRYKKGNLNGCDLSDALELNVDFSKYETDVYTKLPVKDMDSLTYQVNKGYRGGKFYVVQIWKNENDCIIKRKKFTTLYFFDFVYFLNGDLSNAYLLFCDGMKNIDNDKGIDLSNAVMRSDLCEKFGISVEKYIWNKKAIESFEVIQQNEKSTKQLLELINKSDAISEINSYRLVPIADRDGNNLRISYITDIHLMHKLEYANCKTKPDIIYVIKGVVDNIINESERIILIGGDISSDFMIFKLFIEILKWELDYRKIHKNIIFILGNHELWDFPDDTQEEIKEKYRELIEDTGMIFLQNDLLYLDTDFVFHKIAYDELIEKNKAKLREQLRCSRIIILGGIGYSGYNKRFNANDGIYRETLSRQEEILETKKFEKLYEKVVPAIWDKNVIIFTHMPQKDWSKNDELQKGFVYVSGHTHFNEFYDDGEYRLYKDNQVGYYNNNPHMKNFLIEYDYDIFSDCEDGIYEITGAQYNDFYRGKNIKMNFSRDINILYMLKKKGYYCFIHESCSGNLTILNGGALKSIEGSDIQYYYDHMDEVISYIKKPLDKYTNIQKRISEEVCKIGGTGKIHGCIVDIDWYNHIYINPVDMTITGYWALNIIDKIVYPDVPSLLKAECPLLYKNYLKVIKGETNNNLLSKKKSGVAVLPQEYLSTDIYKVSREIKKMQKLSSNILSAWYENPQKRKNIEKRNKR